jgi:hypothetical protein
MKTIQTHLARAACALAACAACAGAASAAVLTENFDNISALIDWQLVNRSSPVGQPWFQGNAGIFAAASGAADSYIGANYLSALNGNGSVDNWLITPALALSGPTEISFATRSATHPAGFNDSLSLLYSPSGRTGVADFTMVLATVGGASAYPTAWTSYAASIDATGSGRFAFRYTGDAATANYIGIDTVNVVAVPEPALYAQLALGLCAVGVLRRRAAQRKPT